MQTVILKPGKANPFWHHEPLVFSGAIARVDGNPVTGELVSVQDCNGQYVGHGFFNAHSIYRVRLLGFHDEPPYSSLAKSLEYRIEKARAYRNTLHLPNQHTDAYRLINSEGDGLSGLTIDVFANDLAIAVTAFWVMAHQDTIAEVLLRFFPKATLHWLPNGKALAQDGWHEPIATTVSHLLSIKENDLLFQVDVSKGQKTGFYCDQRDNRLLLRRYVAGKKILDCFCYSGGFALNAALAGAKRVVAVDSSKSALSLAEANASLNQLHTIEFIHSKAEAILATTTEFDFIILDPPKLAPSKKHIQRAKQAYFKLNQLALAALPSNGMLLTCSCSDAMNESLFLQTIQSAAKKAGRKIRIIAVTGPGLDHRSVQKAQYGAYLKAVWVEVIQ